MTPKRWEPLVLPRRLMLIINKPAGLAVHRGLEAAPAWKTGLRRAAVWLAAAAGAPARQGNLRLLRCSAAIARRWPTSTCCSGMARSARPIGASSRAGRRRTEGRTTVPLGRLDVTRGWWMKHDPNGLANHRRCGRCWGRAAGLTGLAPEPLIWPHASTTGALHGIRLAPCWATTSMAAHRVTAARLAPARARDRGAALQEQSAGQSHRAGAAAHARAADGVRVGRDEPPIAQTAAKREEIRKLTETLAHSVQTT